MNMTDGEITASFRQAKDQKKHIQVLADLNNVPRREMEEKLYQLGLVPQPKPLPEKRCHTRPPDFDEFRAMELYQEGQTDLEISEQLGVSKFKFANWRLDRDLPAHKPKSQKNTEKKSSPERQQEPAAAADKPAGCMVLADLMAILEPLAREVPAAEVRLGHGAVAGVEVSIQYGRSGQAARAAVTICGGADEQTGA